jgi:DNA invertase Pin-like site-specific DNA recombinase
VVRVFEDSGISGAKGRDARPGLDALMKGVSRRDFDMVLAWWVDRLGRSLTGLLELLTELHAKGVELYLHQQGLDTSTPSGKAMFQMMGVILERVLAGMSRVAANGTRSGKPIGRPRLAPETEANIRAALEKGGMGLRKVAVRFGVATGTVQRIARATLPA